MARVNFKKGEEQSYIDDLTDACAAMGASKITIDLTKEEYDDLDKFLSSMIGVASAPTGLDLPKNHICIRNATVTIFFRYG